MVGEVVVPEPGEVVEVRDPRDDQLVGGDARGEELLPVALAGHAELLVPLGEPEDGGGRDASRHQPGVAPHPGAPVGLLHDPFLDQDPGNAGDTGGDDRVVGTDPEVVLVPLGGEVDAQPQAVQLVHADPAALVAVDRRLEEPELEDGDVVRQVRVVRREPGLDLGQGAGDLQHLPGLVRRATHEQHAGHATHRRPWRQRRHPHRAGSDPQHPPSGPEGEDRADDRSRCQGGLGLTGSDRLDHRPTHAHPEGGQRPEEQRAQRMSERRGLAGDSGPALGLAREDARTVVLGGADPGRHGGRAGERGE